MIFYVRLYIHHDNDLIQLHLNGVRLGTLFAKALEAHYKKEAIRFELPDGMEFKRHKGRVYRIKVTLDDKTQKDLIQWVRAFPEQYKCHCIKNIARSYLGTGAIDSLNRMVEDGTWIPEKEHGQKDATTVVIQKSEKRESRGESPDQWLDKVSASRRKTKEQRRQIEEGREKIRSLPVEEILGTAADTGKGADNIAKTAEFGNVSGGSDSLAMPNTDSGEDADDFDASLFFENIRAK